MRLELSKKLIVGVFVVNLGLVLFALLSGFILHLMIPELSDSDLPGLLFGLLWGLGGSSCLVLPFSMGFLLSAVLSKRQALWLLGSLIVVSLLGFAFWGIWFLFLVVLWIGLIFPALSRNLATWIIAVFVWYLGFGFLLHTGVSHPRSQAAYDGFKVRWIASAMKRYREENGAFPEKLSQVQQTASLDMFVSPRGAGAKWQDGPLRRRSAGEIPYPGPARKITSWSEVDGGDYLYRKPANDALTNTIVVMTRPGLLYRNWINVGFVDGRVEKMEPSLWKNRPDVIEFLKQTAALPP